MNKTLFEQIIDRDIPANIVDEDEDIIVIHDIQPQAPVHVLIIPKLCIAKLNEIEDSHASLLAKLMLKIPKVARKLGVQDDFRVVINNGEQAGQTVYHLHLHLLAGRSMHWPPG